MDNIFVSDSIFLVHTEYIIGKCYAGFQKAVHVQYTEMVTY